MRVLIVEDEPLARATLREHLAREVDVDVVGEAADGRAAVEAIRRLAPDLVFLDVRLPELSGLEVLEQVDPRPAVVFTTAFDRYAVAAFELEAVDYLVKPFGRRRFSATLARVRRRLTEGIDHTVPRETGETVSRPMSRLFLRKGRRIVPVAVDRVDRVEGAGDYSQVHCGRETFLVPMRLRDLASRLDGERFVRIHRSHLVNLDRVAEIRARDPHRLEVVLASGDVAPASRSGSATLRKRMRW